MGVMMMILHSQLPTAWYTLGCAGGVVPDVTRWSGVQTLDNTDMAGVGLLACAALHGGRGTLLPLLSSLLGHGAEIC